VKPKGLRNWEKARAQGILRFVLFRGVLAFGLMLFVVMMLDVDQEKIREGFVKFLPVGLIVAVAMLVEMLGLIGVKSMHAQAMGPDPAALAGLSNTAWLGMALYTKYLLPFEVAALILTVGVVAAVALTLRQRPVARYASASQQVMVNPRDRIRIVKMDAVRPVLPTAVPPKEPGS